MRNDRPWGFYEVLETRPEFQVKLLEVLPGMRLSLQSHQFRAEHWHIISGSGFVTVNAEVTEVKPGDSVTIPVGALHRVAAKTDSALRFIEIQTGTSFAENDIVRYEDDFGRIG
jgi:mannose-6-phosphate isomerase